MKRREFLTTLAYSILLLLGLSTEGCIQPKTSERDNSIVPVNEQNIIAKVYYEIQKFGKQINPVKDISNEVLGTTLNQMNEVITRVKENEFMFIGPYIKVSITPDQEDISKYCALVLLNRYLSSNNPEYEIKINEYLDVFRKNSKLTISFYLLRTFDLNESDLNIQEVKNGTGNVYQYLVYASKTIEDLSNGQFSVALVIVNNHPFLLIIKNKDLSENIFYEQSIQSIINNDGVIIFPDPEFILKKDIFEVACEETRKKLLNLLEWQSTGFSEVIVLLPNKNKIIIQEPRLAKKYEQGKLINTLNNKETEDFLKAYIGTVGKEVFEFLKKNGIDISPNDVENWKKQYLKLIGDIFKKYNYKRIEYFLSGIEYILETIGSKNNIQCVLL